MGSSFTSLEKRFNAEVQRELQKVPSSTPDLITETGIAHLPESIQNYLRYCGFVGKPKYNTARITWTNVYLRRGPGQDWMKMSCKQFNATAEPARIVYMKAKLFGLLPFEGRDKYQDGHGRMLIKLMKLFTVANAQGLEMDASGLVTILAEALLVPGYIFEKYISWSSIDSSTAKATITFNGTTVSGIFSFNSLGEFYRFESADRFYSVTGSAYEKFIWTALAGSYQARNGIRFPSAFKAIWNRPEVDYEYFKGTITAIDFAMPSLKEPASVLLK